MYKSLGRYYRTVRHLTLRQVVFQLLHRLRSRAQLTWKESLPTDWPAPTYPLTFTFLNQSVTFENAVDWNYAANGKLWTYNLNYFDWLRSATSPAEGLALIYDFMRQTPYLVDGLEAYPTSLRVVNWRRFLQDNQLHDPRIERHLRAQTTLLWSRLEYHLSGNHLLENACALLMMALHFTHRAWYCKAAELLRAELTEQILSDGGHYERSPTYHQLLTDRLLDVYEALTRSADWVEPSLIAFVAQKTRLMLGWLQAVTFRNGEVPMVNDAAYGIAPTTAQLLQKATRLQLSPTAAILGESGYRMLTTPRLECLIDVGPVGPDHQPGHAHADALSFVLHVDGRPVIVDVGTSTFQPGERRDWERSTAAHNTVTVAGQNSSEVWGGFRVGRRATVRLLRDEENCVEAYHTGYRRMGIRHTRKWEILNERTIRITDLVAGGKATGKHRLFVHSAVPLTIQADAVQLGLVSVTFASTEDLSMQVDTYELPTGFNQYVPAHVICTDFEQSILTTLTIHERTTTDLLF